jgi:hypothetical protein
VRKYEGTSSTIVTMIRAIRLNINDLKIEFFVGILSKNRSKKKLTPNPTIRPPTKASRSIGK